MKKQTLFWAAILFIIQISNAQTITVKGKVTDSGDNNALIGVSVRVSPGNTGTITDIDGNFAVQANQNDQLEFSYIGYNKLTVAINGRTEINVALVSDATNLNQVVVVGTRGAGRAKIETPVPVDVINMKTAMLPTARMDLTSIINYSAPSFNYNKQSGSDGADHIDLATLRGLGPDQSLVLINGKRRHQTAFVGVFGTRGRGNSGTDLNAFPSAAIDRVEILRDGASAQYGSDAIAGVINLVLKKNVNELGVNAGYSAYYDKEFNPNTKKEYNYYVHDGALDGQSFAADMNYGLPIGQNGFINFTLNYINSGKTYRQVLDTSNLFTNKDALPFNPYRRAHGDGSLELFGGFFNAEVPIAKTETKFYAFGGVNAKNSDAFAFTRNFSARPDRFITTNDTVLVEVPGIINTDKDGEKYYNPHIQTKIRDYSLAAGLRGIAFNGWDWDLSNTIGYNDFHFYGDKTFNASLGDVNKNHFDDGGFNFLQNTINLNLDKKFANIMQGFNLAFGAEYRIEKYNIYAGEAASYTNYDTTGVKATGAQGFPGYQPNDEVSADRSNLAAYVDAELDVTKKWLVGAAVRVENYSDFGFTSNFKAASRYKLFDGFNIRGSYSTGFRAPSLQQINFSSTFTTVQGGVISEVKIAPNDNPITKAAGIPKLKQETSQNASFGFSTRLSNNLSLTIDAYQVKVKDRVVLSGQFSAGDPDLSAELNQTLADLKVAYAQFFANAVNTTNKGLDIVIEYNKRFEKQGFKALLTGNIQKMTIDKINVPTALNGTETLRKTFLSEREEKFILASAPPMKLGLNLEYSYNKFTIGTRLTYFGEIELYGYGEDGTGINPMVPTDQDENIKVPDLYKYETKLVTDLYAAYNITDKIKVFAGVDNLLNIHPTLGAVQTAKYWAYNTETGGPWDAVQMGGNGRRFFVRLAFNF